MTGSVAIDVVISLVFIYLLYSLLATIIQEILATTVLRLRAVTLKLAIKRMLDDEGNPKAHSRLLSDAFYDTPTIKYLADEGKEPSYLESRNFSKAVLDILKGKGLKPGQDAKPRISSSLDSSSGIDVSYGLNSHKITDGESFEFLQSLWADSQGDIVKFQMVLEHWFEDTMERTTGWYKKKTQFILFIVGLVIAIIFNVDTIEITGKLSRNPKLTAQIVQQADNFTKAHPNLTKELEQQKRDLDKFIVSIKGDTTKNKTTIDSLQKAFNYNKALEKQQNFLLSKADTLINGDIKNVNSLLGIGINHYSFRGECFIKKVGFFLLSIIGWIITALAISLGAPFWFDLLNKLMRLRSSVATTTSDNSADKGKTSDGAKLINPKG